LANNNGLGGKNGPWVLGILLSNQVKRGEDWFEPTLYTHITLSPKTSPIFYLPIFNSVAINIFT
jgi:hypothetical protein